MTSLVVLQARTNSSRLPGKVLLPVAGMPLVVLAARRAGNTGKRVIVATSTESTDDALADEVVRYGLACHRGSLDNALGRFVSAVEGYEDDALVFRLTADNVFPDGALLDDMEREFVARGLEYLCCNGEPSGVPYGFSAELTRVGHLRTSLAAVRSASDLEHVTPYIRRQFGDTFFAKYKALGKGHFRCTVDCLDEYLCIREVFAQVDDAVNASAVGLVAKLDGLAYQPRNAKLANKLVLGTAQLGTPYGIANTHGVPDDQIAEQLVKMVIANGVSYVDTARAYAGSEAILGDILDTGWRSRINLVTKLSPLDNCPADARPPSVCSFVDASVYQSCAALRTRTLDVLMLHRANHMHDWDGTVWSRLLELKRSGVIRQLGVSVQNSRELDLALAEDKVNVIQMPFNVLDWRWDEMIPVIRRRKRERNVTVHVRSALLQGLLPSTNIDHWRRANARNPEHVVAWLAEASRRVGAESIAQFCLVAVKMLDWVDGVVVGMETLEQATDNIDIFSGIDFSDEVLQSIRAQRPRLERETLNPACWS